MLIVDRPNCPRHPTKNQPQSLPIEGRASLKISKEIREIFKSSCTKHSGHMPLPGPLCLCTSTPKDTLPQMSYKRNIHILKEFGRSEFETTPLPPLSEQCVGILTWYRNALKPLGAKVCCPDGRRGSEGQRSLAILPMHKAQQA